MFRQPTRIKWWHMVYATATIAAVIALGYGTKVGGFVGLFTYALPAIFVLAVLWTGRLATLMANVFAKLTAETWEQIEKTNLHQINVLIKSELYTEATQQLETIIANEPHHTEAMVLAVSVYHKQHETGKARDLCQQLINRNDVATRTVQALMAHIGMAETEITQASANRERADKKNRLLDTINTHPNDPWAKTRFITLLIDEFADYPQAEQLLNRWGAQKDLPEDFVTTTRALLHQKRIKSQTPQPTMLAGPIGAKENVPPQAPTIQPSQDPELNRLLAANLIGSAVDQIETGLKAFPDDFEGWMLLCQIQIQNCHSINLAERTISQVRQNPNFSPTQKSEAATRLRTWKLESMRLSH